MTQAAIEFKGSSFTLPVVYLHDNRPEIIKQALIDKIKLTPAFLKNAPIVLNIAVLSEQDDFSLIQQAVIETGLHIVGISGCKHPLLKKQVIQAKLPLLNEGKSNKTQTSVAVSPLFINHPIRSGQQVYAQGCDLVVNSLVSTGAELIADGNIFIFGTMRGRALAGASGNENAQIFCTELSAELVSIAGQYWLSDKIPARFQSKAARISLDQGTLNIYSLY